MSKYETDFESAHAWYCIALIILAIMWLLRLFFDITNGSDPAPEMSRGWLIAAGIFWLWGLYDAYTFREGGWWRGITGIISLAIIFVLSLDDTDAYDRRNTALLYFIWWMYYFLSSVGKSGETGIPTDHR